MQRHQKHHLDPGHPVRCPDGEADMVGRDEGESACAWVRVHVRGLVVVAWLVEVVGGVGVQPMHAEPKRALCPLWCEDRAEEESQTRRARG
jgi:hypothetical protein